MTVGLGWLPDKPDAEDYDLEVMLCRLSAVGEPPSSFSLAPRVYSVIDQGGLGSCVGAAAGQAIRMTHVRQYLDAGAPLNYALESTKLPSILWLYYWGRAQEHLTKSDSGTRIRLVLNGAGKLGIPPEHAWPYSDRKTDLPDSPAPFRRMPSKSAFRLARDQREPLLYHRVLTSDAALERDVKLAISLGFAVIGGIDVSWSFVHGAFDPTSPIDPAESDIAGGHAMCIVGYDESGYMIVNSWGEGWGDGGFFKASPEFVRSMRDLTVVESAPLYSE